VPLLPPSGGLQRDLALGNYSSSTDHPDLFVLDRGLPLERPELRVFTAKSSFRRVALDTRLPQPGLTPAKWSAQFARFSLAGSPDLVLVLRAGAVNHAEIHVLLANSHFQTAGLQALLPFSASEPSTFRYIPGTSLGAPAIYGIDTGAQGSPQLRIARIGAPPQ
jgi:hypothetical protein